MAPKNKAEQRQAKPDAEVRKAMAELERVSKSSRSEARTDIEYDDGSGLILTSRNGEPAVIEAAPMPAPPSASGIPT